MKFFESVGKKDRSLINLSGPLPLICLKVISEKTPQNVQSVESKLYAPLRAVAEKILSACRGLVITNDGLGAMEGELQQGVTSLGGSYWSNLLDFYLRSSKSNNPANHFLRQNIAVKYALGIINREKDHLNFLRYAFPPLTRLLCEKQSVASCSFSSKIYDELGEEINTLVLRAVSAVKETITADISVWHDFEIVLEMLAVHSDARSVLELQNLYSVLSGRTIRTCCKSCHRSNPHLLHMASFGKYLEELMTDVWGEAE